MMFSVKTSDYQKSQMLNMCDADILDSDVVEGDLTMHISRGYYGERLVGEEEASELLKSSSIINMAGKGAVSLSIGLGIGSEAAVKRVSGVPFLIIFKT